MPMDEEVVERWWGKEDWWRWRGGGVLECDGQISKDSFINMDGPSSSELGSSGNAAAVSLKG